MDALCKRLEIVDKDFRDVIEESRQARQAWVSATDDQQRGQLKEFWLQLVKREEALLAIRQALEAQLTEPGSSDLLEEKYRGVIEEKMKIVEQSVMETVQDGIRTLSVF